jgi:DNA-binding response OmpR family regulator
VYVQQATVYIIEDNAALARELAHLLELNNYTALTHNFDAPTAGATQTAAGANAIAAGALAARPTCVLLDLALPGACGLEVCKALRAAAPALPIIVLTSSAAEFDEVMALNLGANDFITKPYRPAVLLARMAAALKNAQAAGAAGAANQAAGTLTHAGLTFHTQKHQVEHAGRTAQLTLNEAVILRRLMQHPGCVVSRKDLMCELWDSDAFVDDNTLTVNINRLRRALEGIGAPADYIKTHRKAGYSL